jgi:hypothetical protein
MVCMKCNNPLSTCTCADREERMRTASDSPHVAVKWCIKCDKAYHFCKCAEPDFKMRVKGQIMDLPEQAAAIDKETHCHKVCGPPIHPRLGLGSPLCARPKDHDGGCNPSIPPGQKFAFPPAKVTVSGLPLSAIITLELWEKTGLRLKPEQEQIVQSNIDYAFDHPEKHERVN